MATLLTEEELTKALAGLDGWEIRENMLQRTYTLASFAHAILFLAAVGQLAEASGHHPDIRLFGYNKLTIMLTTHSAGGLTDKDFSLARQIQALPQRQPK